MKKFTASLFLVVVALLVTAESLGQTVGASQIRRKTDGGLSADAANALAVGIKRGSTAPASPVTGQLWLDTATTPATLRTFNGTTWEAPPAAAAVTLTDLSAFPSSPYDGQIVWVKSIRRAVVYDATSAKWYFIDAQGAQASASYALEGNYSSAVIAPPNAPTYTLSPGGSVDVGTRVCAISYYNSTGGETTPGATVSITVTSGNQKVNLTFDAGPDEVAGKRINCSKAGQTAPLWMVATAPGRATTSYTLQNPDGWIGPATSTAVNFSAPLPSGWTAYLPDLTAGGCGSTGTSLICWTFYLPNSISSSSFGPRLLFNVPGSPSGWRATWKVRRLRTGWGSDGGSVTAGAFFPLAVVASAASTPAPWMFALVNAPGETSLPISSTATPLLAVQSRNIGAAWTTAPAARSSVWPPITSDVFWLSVSQKTDGSNRAFSLAASSDGWLFFDGKAATQDASQTLCNTGDCASVDMPFVGIALERTTGSGTLTGLLMEISDFVFEPL